MRWLAACLIALALLAAPAEGAHRDILKSGRFIDMRCAYGVHAHFLTGSGWELPRIFASPILARYDGTEGSEGISLYRRGRHRASDSEWAGGWQTLANDGRGRLRVRWHCRSHPR